MNIKEVWNSSENEVWKRALSEASKDTGRDDLIETKMSKLNVEYLKKIETREFYNFLYNDYFLWKHIDKRWLENVRKLFKKKYDHNLEELAQIQKDIFEFDLDNINLGLRRATQIYGVGISGASGLLSLLYPSYFGTVDVRVVEALRTTDEYKDDLELKEMNGENIKIGEATYLINIFRKKAGELNKLFDQYCWTPRDIDVILWFFRYKK